MLTRKLAQADWLPLNKLWSVCYLREMNIEEAMKRLEEKPITDTGYGVFTDEGELVSGMLGIRFIMNFDGQPVDMVGVGGVATHPLYRRTGAVRDAIRLLLKEAREGGALFSGLYPFSHSFYRKFGYELGRTSYAYTFPISLLRAYSADMDARMLMPDDDRAVIAPVYRAFASRYNLAIERNAERMKSITSSNPYAKNDYAFAIYESGAPKAYVCYTTKDTNRLRVRDLAFVEPKDFTRILGFLYRLGVEFADIEIELPADIPLLALLDSPYDVKLAHISNYMIRALNCAEILKRMRREGDYRFVIEIEDEFLPENGGKWLVTPGDARPTELPADITMSVRAFSQLVSGCAPLSTALMRDDVRLRSSADALARAFIQKPVMTGVYF